MQPEDDIFSVVELTSAIKDLLEEGFPRVAVRGEISNLRVQASGHHYFSLKDPQSQLSSVMFRGNALSLDQALADGQEVICVGNISVYPPRGNYQLIVRMVIPEGTGDLARKFEALKKRLAEEGLFDPERKRELPRFPRSIGIVTSPTGAALQDFLRILQRRRWTGHVMVYPSIVQGAEAVPSMLEMLAAVKERQEVDLLVIGRGGGSLEDLWAFNEESLVRSLVEFPVPVISAVGHEIDFVLTDFVADVRAETPSAAAELISSGYLEMVSRFESVEGQLVDLVEIALNERGQLVDYLGLKLEGVSPANCLQENRRRIERLVDRLKEGFVEVVGGERERLQSLQLRLQSQSPEHRFKLSVAQVSALATRLHNASVGATLERGFALVFDDQGKVIKSVCDLEPGQQVNQLLSDGKTRIEILDTELEKSETRGPRSD